MGRPKTYTIAASIQLVLALVSLVTGVPQLFMGAEAYEQASGGVPYFIVVLSFSLAILGLVSAYGLWRNQKWGVLLTIVLRLLDGLSALPGILIGPTLLSKALASLGVLIAVVVIGLLLWPKPKLPSASHSRA